MKKLAERLPDWLVRSLKTFVQAFLACMIPGLANAYSYGGVTADVLESLLRAALAAAICAVWNGINAAKGGEG